MAGMVQKKCSKVFEVSPTSIPGCVLIDLCLRTDSRGSLVKTFQASTYHEGGLEVDFREEFYSFSTRGVLRGMHVMAPPAGQVKTVCCALGTVLDAVLDLRINSPSYGRYELFQMDAAMPQLVYIPPGVAHGFLVLSEQALMIYRATSEFLPEADKGVRWDSCGIPWGVTSPVISARDQALPLLADFVSPFHEKVLT